ncbi:MAG: RHS repeat-associated core domain-containing protein [Brevundimonas sp.]|uniref:RHS repeat-associated core domain-containing protein n=1 Tax=Brevundimonas sp. TaxID=1871086 RepID=UPI003919FCC7
MWRSRALWPCISSPCISSPGAAEPVDPGQMPPGLGAGGGVFGYTGRQYDAETGLYQYRARYYHPRLGQFLSTDPIGTRDDPNLTLYVLGDPVNHTDPSGLCVTDPRCRGSWGEAEHTASSDQSTLGLQRQYASGQGGMYYLDPRAWRLETSIDIGTDIQNSVNSGGYYRAYALRAVTEGVPVNVPQRARLHGFNMNWIDAARSPSGREIGRFSGAVSGMFIPNSDLGPRGYYFVGSMALRTGNFGYAPDGVSRMHNAAIRAWGLSPDGLRLGPGVPLAVRPRLRMEGAPVSVTITRRYNFLAWGTVE